MGGAYFLCPLAWLDPTATQSKGKPTKARNMVSEAFTSAHPGTEELNCSSEVSLPWNSVAHQSKHLRRVA